MRVPILALLAALAACTGADAPRTEPTPRPSAPAPQPAPKAVTISVVGTNDLHGRVSALPLLAGYVENLRRERAKDGGVVLVDAGDMFQGTLESNLLEGTPVRDAYSAMGYAAVAIGNHEFDYGPVGPAATPTNPGDDPRGALKALAKGASFPFLTANVADKATGRHVEYPNMPASALVTVAGVPIGIVGVTTEKTLETTISSNVRDLQILPLAETIAREAKDLRSKGARAVIALAHAGSKCKTFTKDVDADHCETQEEIFRVARALPRGTLDVIVAGHTHAGLAHEIEGIAVIESFAYGRAFGRVDLEFGPPAEDKFNGAAPPKHTIFAPQELCAGSEKPDFDTCAPSEYAGAKVERVAKVAAAIEPGVSSARSKRNSSLGVVLEEKFEKDYHFESPLGNLYAQLILDGARKRPGPQPDVALTNGGGLREDLPAGELRYGTFFESFPFDNRMATAKITVGDFKRVLAAHLRATSGGILSIAGVRVVARCKGKELDVTLEREPKGKALRDEDTITVVTSDFILLGGDGFWGGVKPPEVQLGDDLVRDVIEAELRTKKTISPGTFLVKTRPRLDLPKARPVQCQ